MHDLRGALTGGEGEGFLFSVDPRVKLFAVAGLLVINLFARGGLLPAGLLIACGGLLLSSGLPFRTLGVRLFLPAVIAFFVLLTQTFWVGGEHLLLDGSVAGIHLTATLEGLHRGGRIAFQVLSGVLLILLLTWTTPSWRLIAALRWYRFPETMIEIGLLMFRYLFLFFEEGGRIREAQKVRLGYVAKGDALRSASILGGMLFIRAYDRAERLIEAMRCRGGSGREAPLPLGKDRPLFPEFVGALVVMIFFFFLR